MGNKHDLERYKAGWDDLYADEKAAVRRALRRTPHPGDVVAIVQARGRSLRRKQSDAATDQARRILVGARLPRAQAEKYRACAREHGLSLYRFVCNALEREFWRLRDHDIGGIM